MKESIALLSGGLDSAVALAIESRRTSSILCLSFWYGQTHSLELHAAKRIAEFYECDWLSIPIGAGPLFGDSPLIEGRVPEALTLDEIREAGLSNAYVPARNLLFLAYGAMAAETHSAKRVVIGCNRDDQLGFPDCRPEFFDAFSCAMGAGTVVKPGIVTPLSDCSKVEVVSLAAKMVVPIASTVSCYDPKKTSNATVVHCGRCEACIIRREAFETSGFTDPTVYSDQL